jgi:hypothetical protein
MGVRKPLDLGECDDVNWCSSFGAYERLASIRRYRRLGERGAGGQM